MKDGRIFTEFGLEQKTDHVEVTLEAGKVEVDNALVEIVLKEGQEVTFTPQTDEEREKYEKGFVPFNGRWIKKKNAERAIKKDLEDRLEQAEEDLAHQEWRNKYETETKHFRWFHTTPQRVTRRFMASSDAYYDIFKKDWGIKRNKRKPKLSINFYNDASEYQQIAGAPRAPSPTSCSWATTTSTPSTTAWTRTSPSRSFSTSSATTCTSSSTSSSTTPTGPASRSASTTAARASTRRRASSRSGSSTTDASPPSRARWPRVRRSSSRR